MTENLIFIYKGAEGTFRTELDANYCSFVLRKGEKKGQLCGNRWTFSTFFNQFIPCCILHLNHYEAQFGHLETTRERRAKYKEPDFFYEATEHEFLDVKPKAKKDRKNISLDEIPKAIERSMDCVVCFEKDNALLLPCGHTVCFSCVQSLSKKSCPMCRCIFSKEQLRRL